jgi:SAM-dependent methyltransferase
MSTETSVATADQPNIEAWARGNFVGDYASRELRPVEVLLMVRYRDELARRVVELGCGAGRLTGYLLELGEDVYGIDVSPPMIAECRRRYPAGQFLEGDMQDLSRFGDGSVDAVVAGCNVLDVLDDEERRAMLREIRRTLRHGGVLIMSSHNRGYLPHVRGPLQLRWRQPRQLLYDLKQTRGRVRRHAALRPLERQTPDYAIVSDGAHEFALVHYFTSPEAQFRQFREEGFTPLVCLDLDGGRLGPGDAAADCSELHYVASKHALTAG